MGFLRRHTDLAVLLLVTVLAYSVVFQAGFAWDDAAIVAGNRLTHSLLNLPELFLVDLWNTTRLLPHRAATLSPCF